MYAFKWMHAVTAAALLGTFVGCDDQDFNPEAETIETQPAGTYDADPGVLDGTDTDEVLETDPIPETDPTLGAEGLGEGASGQELNQDAPETTLDAEGEVETNDNLGMLNNPSGLDTELPQEQTADEAPIETAGETETAVNEDATSEAEPVAEDAEPVAEDVVEEE